METRIKHVAICTENYDRMAEFYKSIFGMKKITNGMRLWKPKNSFKNLNLPRYSHH